MFETEDEMVAWLIRQGHSEQAAREFVRLGSVPSGLVFPQQEGPPIVVMGIHQLDVE